MKPLLILILLLTQSSCASAQSNKITVVASEDSKAVLEPSKNILFSCEDGYRLVGRIWNRTPKNEGCLIGQDPYIKCAPEPNYTDVKLECVK